MANVAKKAIITALVEGVLTDLMVKTTGEQVYLDDSTSVSAKIAEMVAAINERAKSTDVTAEISTAINNLIDGAPETYNTLKEIADYITSHQEVVDAINAAIGNKADKTAFDALKSTVDALGALSKKDQVSETDLDSALQGKINAASQGNHTHANKDVLDGITTDKISAWDGKSKVYYSATQPEGLAEGDLWVQLIE